MTIEELSAAKVSCSRWIRTPKLRFEVHYDIRVTAVTSYLFIE